MIRAEPAQRCGVSDTPDRNVAAPPVGVVAHRVRPTTALSESFRALTRTGDGPVVVMTASVVDGGRRGWASGPGCGKLSLREPRHTAAKPCRHAPGPHRAARGRGGPELGAVGRAGRRRGPRAARAGAAAVGRTSRAC